MTFSFNDQAPDERAPEVLQDRNTVLKLVEVARLYYEEGRTQSEIGSVLGVSRPLVSNMLQTARELGIVRIEIRSPFEGDDKLLARLKDKYALSDGLVVPAQGDNLSYSLKTLVSQGSRFVATMLSGCSFVGFGWGTLMSKLVDGLGAEEIRTNNQTRICPLIGSMASPSIDWHPNEMVRRCAERFGIDAAFMHAPAFPTSSMDYKVFQATEEYTRLSAIWQKLDTAIIEIETYPSVPDQATAMRFGDMLKKNDAVGSLLSYFYDVRGNLIEGPNDYVNRISLENSKAGQKCNTCLFRQH